MATSMEDAGTLPKRERTKTPKGLSYELDTAVRQLRQALKNDELEVMITCVTRIESLAETELDLDPGIKNMIRHAKERIVDANGREQQDSSQSHDHAQVEQLQKHSDSASKLDKKESSVKSSGKSMGSVKSEIRLKLEMSRIELEKIRLLEESDVRAAQAQMQLEHEAVVQKFRMMDISRKNINEKASINIQSEMLAKRVELAVEDDQLLGSDDEDYQQSIDQEPSGFDKKENFDRIYTKTLCDQPRESDERNRGQDHRESNVVKSSLTEMKVPQEQTLKESQNLCKDVESQSKASKEPEILARAFDRMCGINTSDVKFSGIKDRHLYVQFLLRFKNGVASRSGFSNYEKLFKLQDMTTGDARLIVDSCVILGDDGLQEALKKLDDRYGDPYELALSIVKNLTNGPQLDHGDNNAVVKFCDDVTSGVRVLQKLTDDTDDGTDFVKIGGSYDNMIGILKRLPATWRNSLLNSVKHPTLEYVLKFLERKTRNLNSYLALAVSQKSTSKGSGSTPTHIAGSYRKVGQVHSTTDAKSDGSPSNQVCSFCDRSNHGLLQCRVFKGKISPNEKRIFLRKQGLCFNCYGTHLASECPAGSMCKFERCSWKSKHNGDLHNLKSVTNGDERKPRQQFQTLVEEQSTERRTDPVIESESEPEQEPVVSENTEPELVAMTDSIGQTKSQSAAPVLPVVPILVTSPVSGRSVKTFGCLDTMSTIHCGDERLLNALGLNPHPVKSVINTIHGEKEVEVRITPLVVKGLHSDSRSYRLNSVEFVPGQHISKVPIPSQDFVAKHSHLQGIEKQFAPLELNMVTILIGASLTEAHITRDVRYGESPGCPVALRTDLGWTVFGGGSTGGSSMVNVNFTSDVIPSDLGERLQLLWAIESNSVFKPRNGESADDQMAASILESSLRERDDGRYELSLLLREPNPMFPDNRKMAEQMLHRLRRRFAKDPEYLRMYKEQVDQYLANGFARVVPKEETPAETGKSWYIVHHGVTHERKPGKVRVVFNCSGEFMGVSLNQKLYCGPDFINLLVGVLIRFRIGRVAVCADISAMYHQVRVPEDQTRYLKWLWFENGDPKSGVIELEMLVHIFGSLSSSSCANFALRQCAQQFPENSSEYSQITRSFYVDDFLSSFENSSKATETVMEVFKALKQHGFVLNKFCATHSEVIENIPVENVAQGAESADVKEIKSRGMHEQSTLGVRWDPNLDVFIFKVIFMDVVCSKRGVLSAIARVIYDPCGVVISVLMLPARLLFQEICRRRAEWDEPLSDEEDNLFRRWYSGISSMKPIQVPRCVHPQDFGEVERRELHFFSDASEKCYGTACYLREVDSDGRVACSLIFAKSRLAPLKRTLTLVRLELQAAATSTMAKNLITSELDVDVNAIYFWTDSMPVLGYINNDQKRYQVFTANRIAQVRDSSEPVDWHWVPSEMNSCDLITRGVRDYENFDENHEWFKGPKFLREPTWNFPESPVPVPSPADNDPEVRQNQSIFIIDDANRDEPGFTEKFLVKFKNLYSAKIGVVVMKKFLDYLRTGTKPEKVSLADLQRAETTIISIAQREKYGDMVRLLRDNPDARIPKECSLRKLSPFIGDDGLLRVGGKMKNSSGSLNFCHPIILPKGHHVTECLIREYHTYFGHSSVLQILNELRMKFHVVGGRNTVHGVWSKCIDCRRLIARPMEQYMNDLPASRLKPFEPAFSYCSVDLFGHFFVKVKRSNVKRWGVVFVCDSSKAVHLEIVHSLDMSSFLEALLRMARRRTWPKQIRSDQGSNLRAADKEIRAALQRWNDSGIEERLRQRTINWIFTPPTGSHMNGLAERTIRSAREILVHLLNEQTLTDETIRTAFVECEYILNNRPIAEFSNDPKDGRALTPAHLLQPRSEEISLPMDLFSPDDNYHKRRWRQTQYIADVFWRRMVKEVYQILQKRQKWLERKSNVKVDDFVMIVDPNVHRNDWRVGRVIEVKVSRDGLVRSCHVKTKTGVFERPISKLCMLEAALL